MFEILEHLPYVVVWPDSHQILHEKLLGFNDLFVWLVCGFMSWSTAMISRDDQFT